MALVSARIPPFVSYHEVRVAILYQKVEGVLIGGEGEFVVSVWHPIQALDCNRPEVSCELGPCVIG